MYIMVTVGCAKTVTESTQEIDSGTKKMNHLPRTQSRIFVSSIITFRKSNSSWSVLFLCDVCLTMLFATFPELELYTFLYAIVPYTRG